MTFAFTGNGNVSRGAQEVFEELPHEWVDPDDIGNLPPCKDRVYGCIVEAQHMVERIGSTLPFNRDEYAAFGPQHSTIFRLLHPLFCFGANFTSWVYSSSIWI